MLTDMFGDCLAKFTLLAPHMGRVCKRAGGTSPGQTAILDRTGQPPTPPPPPPCSSPTPHPHPHSTHLLAALFAPPPSQDRYSSGSLSKQPHLLLHLPRHYHDTNTRSTTAFTCYHLPAPLLVKCPPPSPPPHPPLTPASPRPAHTQAHTLWQPHTHHRHRQQRSSSSSPSSSSQAVAAQ